VYIQRLYQSVKNLVRARRIERGNLNVIFVGDTVRFRVKCQRLAEKVRIGCEVLEWSTRRHAMLGRSWDSNDRQGPC
jgi:hypothetical protein